MKNSRLKKIPFSLLVRLTAVVTFAAGFSLFSILENGRTDQPVWVKNSSEVFEVKLLPVFDEKSSKEERFWRYQKFLDPSTEIPDPIPTGLPNYCGDLIVLLDGEGRITLNSEENGSVENTDVLKRRLEKIFKSRAEASVYRVNSSEVVKHVIVKAHSSAKYGNLVKVVEAVKSSGADPVILQTGEEIIKQSIFKLDEN